MENGHDFLIVEGVRFPPPDKGFSISTSQAVDAGRNANQAFVGQKVGRRIWKIDGLQWSGLDAESWAEMKSSLEPFSFGITLDDGRVEWHQIATNYLKSWKSQKGIVSLTATDRLSQMDGEYSLGFKIYQRTAYEEAERISIKQSTCK